MDHRPLESAGLAQAATTGRDDNSRVAEGTAAEEVTLLLVPTKKTPRRQHLKQNTFN